MSKTAQHAAKRDHLWVLFIIAACVLLEVWVSWVTIGSNSGFPRIGGKFPTDWTLGVTTEAYWGYALYAWLGAASGRRSRRFAMYSAAAVFTLSLVGQGSAHLVRPGVPPPATLVVFVSALPVIILALIAILIHLRQLDREEAEQTARREREAEAEAERLAAANDERAALRAEIETLNAAVADAETARREAERTAAAAEAKAAALTRKLEARPGAKGTRKAAAKQGRTSPAAKVPNDVDARAEALRILDAEPGITGAELAKRCGGMSERWGQLRKKEYGAHVPGADPSE